MRKAIAAIILALFLSASVSAAPQVYKHKFTKGGLGKYHIETVRKNTSIGPDGVQESGTLNLTLTLLQRTTEASPDGMGIIKCTLKDIKITSSDLPSGRKYTPKNETITVFVAADGRRSNVEGLKINTDNPFEAAYTIGEQIVFPAKPISVGDTWESKVQIPGFGTDMHITSTLISDEEIIWGQKASKIKQVYSAKVDLAKLLRQEEADAGKKLTPFEVTGTMDLSGSTECLFSQSKGLLLTAKSLQKVMAKMTLAIGTNGNPVPVDVIQESTVVTTRFK